MVFCFVFFVFALLHTVFQTKCFSLSNFFVSAVFFGFLPLYDELTLKSHVKCVFPIGQFFGLRGYKQMVTGLKYFPIKLYMFRSGQKSCFNLLFPEHLLCTRHYSAA